MRSNYLLFFVLLFLWVTVPLGFGAARLTTGYGPFGPKTTTTTEAKQAYDDIHDMFYAPDAYRARENARRASRHVEVVVAPTPISEIKHIDRGPVVAPMISPWWFALGAGGVVFGLSGLLWSVLPKSTDDRSDPTPE